jgi:hypothetical protein
MPIQRRQFLTSAALLPIVAGLSACGSLVRAPVPGGLQVRDLTDMLHNWADILREHVDAEGRVNFAAVAAQPAQLHRIVRFIESESPQSHPQRYPTRDIQLAYHLNAYNALCLNAVIAAGIPRDLNLLGRLRFFKLNDAIIGGQRISLYDYENRIIRLLGEPRIHFALNCMSVGCPRLPRVPFGVATMNAQLETEAQRFFAEARNLRVDHASQTVYYSEILKFYTDDFLAVASSLADYASRYVDKPVPAAYATRFTPYDWTINRWPNT